PELVAGSAQCLERERVAELGAQTADVDVDGARAAFVSGPPHTGEQRVAPEYAPAIPREEREQRELLRRQRNATPGRRDLVPRAIDDALANLEPFLRRKFAPLPLERADARVELGGRAGDPHEIVESARRLDSRDLPRGHREDRRRLLEVRLPPHA